MLDYFATVLTLFIFTGQSNPASDAEQLQSLTRVCYAESPYKLGFIDGSRSMVPDGFCLLFHCLAEYWNAISFQAGLLSFCTLAFSFLLVPSTQGD